MVCLALTKDFLTYQRHGVIFCLNNREVEIFPEKIRGKYFALHRSTFGEYQKREI